MASETKHISVLLDEVFELMGPALQMGDDNAPRTFLDCTLGGGGHTEAALSRFPNLIVRGCDRDRQALERSRARLANYSNRTQFFHANFQDVFSVLDAESGSTGEKQRFNGVLCDLGISSDQLDDPERGFSFNTAAPLDMRMDQSLLLTAAEVLNTYSVRDLARVFRRGDVGHESQRLAQAIFERRPVRTTVDFAQICSKVIHGSKRNPATVPFQAVRMEVNGELDALDKFLAEVPERLLPGGRLVMICFHSLEDKLVARAMRSWAREELRPRSLVSARMSQGKMLTPKAVVPSEEEIERNPRSRSARLRAFEWINLH